MTSENNNMGQSGRKTLLENYGFKTGKVIGIGTYAKVKLAYFQKLKHNVAIKEIMKHRAPKEYLIKFLPREIEVVKGLRHPNLIKFYQSIETTHRVYLIMQYAENGSLLDLIRKHGFFIEPLARKYFRELISAVEYIHKQGVVHRDIKCENLLLTKDYELKLIDFGFARKNILPVNNKPVLSETFCGSFAYASPEILQGVPYDPRISDIWASGVVLYAMVCGRLPFVATYLNQFIKQVQSRVTFPKTPLLTAECQYLILKVLSPLRTRISIKGIRNNIWFKEEISKSVIDDFLRMELASPSLPKIEPVAETVFRTKIKPEDATIQRKNADKTIVSDIQLVPSLNLIKVSSAPGVNIKTAKTATSLIAKRVSGPSSSVAMNPLISIESQLRFQNEKANNEENHFERARTLLVQNTEEAGYIGDRVSNEASRNQETVANTP